MIERPAPSPTTRPDPGVRAFRPFSSLVQVDVSARSHPGHVRPNNEDQFYVTKVSRALETMLSSLPPDALPERAEEVNFVFVVADGMGGHAAGEIASRLAISSLVNLALDVPDWSFKIGVTGTAAIEERAREIVQQVGAVIYERGHIDENLRGMGTTLTAARSLGRDLMIVHVGDSRAYVMSADRLHRLTKDHTYAQRLVDSGALDPRDVASSGVRHVLTNVLGGSTDDVHVDIGMLRLETGDRLLICSDGLTDLVDDDEIAETLKSATSSDDACERLMKMALDAGGRDNVTVIVARYTFPD